MKTARFVIVAVALGSLLTACSGTKTGTTPSTQQISLDRNTQMTEIEKALSTQQTQDSLKDGSTPDGRDEASSQESDGKGPYASNETGGSSCGDNPSTSGFWCGSSTPSNNGDSGQPKGSGTPSNGSGTYESSESDGKGPEKTPDNNGQGSGLPPPTGNDNCNNMSATDGYCGVPASTGGSLGNGFVTEASMNNTNPNVPETVCR